jgi:uncharacterized protein YheU (UPF0270 family)
MVTLSKIQAEKLNNLLNNFIVYENQNMGKITNIMLMTNPIFKGSIFIRYEQTSSMSAVENYDLEIVEINDIGLIEKLNDKFKNAFERYAFLGECVVFDKNDIVIAD